MSLPEQIALAEHHAARLAGRIAQLGGAITPDPTHFVERAQMPIVDLPDNTGDVDWVLGYALEQEQRAIERYGQLLDRTRGFDIVTVRLLVSILTDKVAREDDIESALPHQSTPTPRPMSSMHNTTTAGVDKGFNDQQTELTIPSLDVVCVIPSWLSGTLVRNGPARFHLEDKALNHWFDAQPPKAKCSTRSSLPAERSDRGETSQEDAHGPKRRRPSGRRSSRSDELTARTETRPRTTRQTK